MMGSGKANARDGSWAVACQDPGTLLRYEGKAQRNCAPFNCAPIVTNSDWM